jgi:hypothetical protein
MSGRPSHRQQQLHRYQHFQNKDRLTVVKVMSAFKNSMGYAGATMLQHALLPFHGPGLRESTAMASVIQAIAGLVSAYHLAPRSDLRDGGSVSQ